MGLPTVTDVDLYYSVEENGCWKFTGNVHPTTGYGRISVKGKWHSAPRVFFNQFKGKFDENLQVCHTCDNRECVNPDHLFLGTNLDNHRDMWAKKRGKVPSPKRGETSPVSKLSDDEREDIKGLRQNGLTLKEIATLYGVGISTIHRIVKDK